MRKMTHPFFHDASILVSVGVFLTHQFETVGVFAHFLCVKNAKTPSIWSSVDFNKLYFRTRIKPMILKEKHFHKLARNNLSQESQLLTFLGNL